MIKGINHIGIVVRDMNATLAFMEKAFGACEIKRISSKESGQTSCLITICNDKFEIMEPIGNSGVIAKYLQTHGEGFHHISLETDDLDEDCEKLDKQGIKILGKTATNDFRIAFTHPKTTGGVLYEIVQFTEK